MSCARSAAAATFWVMAAVLLLGKPGLAQAFSYEGDVGGTKQSFTVPRGNYELSLIVSQEIPSSDPCLFSGRFERTSPNYWSLSLGSAIEISKDDFPYALNDHDVALPAGQYVLWISLQTTCHWYFSLIAEPKAGGNSSARVAPCCLGPVTMIKNYLFLPTPSTSTSYRDFVRFEAPYESKYGLKEIGLCEFRQGDKLITETVLKVDKDSSHKVFYVVLQLSRFSALEPGAVSVLFHTTMGDSTGKFTLTK